MTLFEDVLYPFPSLSPGPLHGYGAAARPQWTTSWHLLNTAGWGRREPQVRPPGNRFLPGKHVSNKAMHFPRRQTACPLNISTSETLGNAWVHWLLDNLPEEMRRAERQSPSPSTLMAGGSTSPAAHDPVDVESAGSPNCKARKIQLRSACPKMSLWN